MTDETAPPDIRPRRPAFPWPSALAGLGLAAWLLAASEPTLLRSLGLIPEGYQLHLLLRQPEFKLAGLALLAAIIVFDLLRHRRRLRRFEGDIRRLRTELRQVWESKKQLQMKVHTYAGHADKLKLFISEKLLEYIEYDEKFLHFKSIAAEVRHNGVIGFDKVRTALEAHLDADNAGPEARQRDRDAHTAMRYLWDLLDLSTTDNIALHIGNQLCEHEEHYYQLLLNRDEPADGVPHRPDFPPRRAALRALAPLLQTSPPYPEALDETAEPLVLDDDPQFRAFLDPTEALLGNENHLVLLLENLLKNAQFFTRKKTGSAPHRIALTLSQQEHQIELSVYNRGPHIGPRTREQMFQLGYSTRRVKEHHGKGLGLFFVQQIVRGYEGRIDVENVDNRSGLYSLRVTLEDDRVSTEVIEVVLDDKGRPRCRPADRQAPGQEGQPRLEREFDRKIARVELTPPQHHTPLTLEPEQGQTTLLDPADPSCPHWEITLSGRRKGAALTFRPLDIAGVRFRVQLPTARARLEGEEAGLTLADEPLPEAPAAPDRDPG